MVKESKYLEKKIRKYVIVTVDGMYLRKDIIKGEYYFFKDIEAATKAENRNVANDLLKYFYCDTNSDVELVVIPLDITYELIDETI